MRVSWRKSDTAEQIERGVYQMYEDKIEEILKELTIKEKVAMCRANSKFFSNGVERLGIDELTMSDGPHGVREEYERHRWVPLGREEDKCTYLPNASALAATWNRDRAFDFGDCLGGEARARNKDIILGPGINIMRTPLCGRNFEYLSEDPYLVKEMAIPLVRGIQKNDTAACVKHYILNNQELNRNKVNVHVNKRALFETYLAGFEGVVKEAKAYAIMGAYNQYEGQHCCHNKYLVKDVLKGEFGFDGVYITDWGGCQDLKEAVYNGLDLEMGTSEDYDKFYFTKAFEEMAKTDEVAAAELDDKVRRILRLMMRVHKIGGQRFKGEFNSNRHQEIAYQVASEAVVLLKNENTVLPVTDMKKILVIGENADVKHALGGNSAAVPALYEITPLQGLKNKCSADCEIIYMSEEPVRAKAIKDEYLDIVETTTGCRGFRREAYDNLYCLGESHETLYVATPLLTGEPRTDYTYRYFGTVTIPKTDEYKFVISGKRGVFFRVNGRGCVDFETDETVQKTCSFKCKEGERLELEIEVQPQTPNPVLNFGWIQASQEEMVGQDEILKSAAAVDTVIYFGGLNHNYDIEGRDRSNINLPDEQNIFIDKLLTVREDAIICIIAGSSVSMPWIHKAKAVLFTGYAGMEGGNALADIILGNVSPSGHLPYTIPYRYKDTPVARYGEYKADEEYYNDGIYVGYKGYEKDDIEPLFPFGHGLTYSTFEYTDFSNIGMNKYALNVKNIGKKKARTVLQLYIGRTALNLDFPVKELRDFQKIELDVNEKKTVVFEIKEEFLRYYDEERDCYVLPKDGTEYTLYIGESSKNILYSAKSEFCLVKEKEI